MSLLWYPDPSVVFRAYLLSQGLEAVQEARPEVLEKWSVDSFQAIFGAGIHTDIQLSNWHQTPGNERKQGEERRVRVI